MQVSEEWLFWADERERQFEHTVRNISEDGTNEASEAIHEALLLLLLSDSYESVRTSTLNINLKPGNFIMTQICL